MISKSYGNSGYRHDADGGARIALSGSHIRVAHRDSGFALSVAINLTTLQLVRLGPEREPHVGTHARTERRVLIRAGYIHAW